MLRETAVEGRSFSRRFAETSRRRSPAPSEREMSGIGSRKRLAPPSPPERVEDRRLIEHRLRHIHGGTQLVRGRTRRGARARATCRVPADASARRRLSPAGAVALRHVNAATGEAFGVPERAKRERLELHGPVRAQRRALEAGIVGDQDAGIVGRETPDQRERAHHGRRDRHAGNDRDAHEPIMRPGALRGDERPIGLRRIVHDPRRLHRGRRGR